MRVAPRGRRERVEDRVDGLRGGGGRRVLDAEPLERARLLVAREEVVPGEQEVGDCGVLLGLGVEGEEDTE